MKEPITVEERRSVCADADCTSCDGTGIRVRRSYVDVTDSQTPSGLQLRKLIERLELCGCVHSVLIRTLHV
jgi:hypothetical protein